MGVLLAASSGLSIALIVGIGRGSATLSAEKFAKALVIGLTSGLGTGAITWWILDSTGEFVFWMGLWLLGGVGVGAATAMFNGLAARLRKDDTIDGPEATGVSNLRRWSGWLVTGGIISVVCGLILVVIGRSGGLLLVRRVAVTISRLGLGLVNALSMSLLLATAGAAFGCVVGAFLGAVVGVLKGVTGPDVERRTRPNQGIRQSAYNMAVFSLLGILVGGLPYGLLNITIAAVVTRLSPTPFDWLHLALVPAAYFGLLGALIPGAACVQHFTLRFVLWCFGLAPWQYARFLNYATERMLLQRIGGRYRFMHDLLRDRLAGMEPTK
jgi:hypothetical protein